MREGLVKYFTVRNIEQGLRKIIIAAKEAVWGLRERDPSENLDFILGDGRVEKLVREGRAPIRMGSVGSPGMELQPYYQVAPRGYNPKNIEEVYSSCGCFVYVFKNGRQMIGSTYTLTVEQSERLEERIRAEKKRLGLE